MKSSPAPSASPRRFGTRAAWSSPPFCVSAASLRMRPPRPRALVPMVAEAAAKLSRGLGRRDTPSDAITSPHTTTLPASADMQNAGLGVTGPRPNGHGNGHILPHPATHLALT